MTDTGYRGLSPEIAVGADVLVRDYMAVKPGEVVLITADSESDTIGVAAIYNSARNAGAKPAVLTLPQLPFQGALADPYISPTVAGAVGGCDVWIDLTFPYLAGAQVYDQAMEAGKIRYILVGDLSAAGVGRLFGKVNLDHYYAVHKAFDEITAAAVGREVRITNEAGTDVTFKLEKPSYTKPRRAEKPGMVVVPGACTMFPDIESVKGIIRLDAVFHEYFTALTEPMTFVVDGRIREVSGGGAERRVMDRALRRAAGGEYGHVIHFTNGINPAARVTNGSFVEDMRAIGNDAVGFGIPWWLPGGGENHPDGIAFQQSVWIDGEHIVQDGTIVGPSDLTELASKLEPIYV